MGNDFAPRTVQGNSNSQGSKEQSQNRVGASMLNNSNTSRKRQTSGSHGSAHSGQTINYGYHNPVQA